MGDNHSPTFESYPAAPSLPPSSFLTPLAPALASTQTHCSNKCIDVDMIPAGKKVAWNAFAIVDGFGQKAPPVHAAKDLVDNVMTEMRQAGQVVSIPEGASCEELAYAVQDSFTQALPQVCHPLLFAVLYGHFDTPLLHVGSQAPLVCLCPCPHIPFYCPQVHF